jgi:hypothetical protein
MMQGQTTCAHRLLLVTLFCYLAAPSLEAQWTKAVGFDDSDMALDLAEALSYQKYPTYDQYLEMMQGFAMDHPEICRLDTIGITVQGRQLLALKISDHVEDEEDEATFLYTSSMHGNEIVGYVLLLRLADTLLNGYGSDSELTTLVDNLQIWINPLANPDGSFSNDNDLSLEHARRTNTEGIDLNRDFPNPGAGEADDTTGRALENRYMMEFLKKNQFTLSANIHSGEEVVNYPWDYDTLIHADDEWYRFISHEYADEAMAVDPDYMFGWPDGGITHGAEWYIALGTRQDYVNYSLEGREVTLELSIEYLLDSDELEQHWNINQRSLINYMSQCLYGIRGKVTDLESGEPIRAKIEIPGHDSTYSVVHSSETHGDYYRLIQEGIYELVASAPGYFNDTILAVSVTDYQATQLNIQLEPYATSIPDPEAPAFRIYPNPAVNSFVVEPASLPHGQLELSVHSLDGRMIFQNTVSYHGSGMEFSTQQMESGIYLLRCSSGKHTEVHRLMVIKH